MGILVIFMLLGLIMLYLIPELLGHTGLTEWYCEEYDTEDDVPIILVYLPFSAISGYLIFS